MSKRTNWVDRNVEYPRRIELTKVDGTKEIVTYEPKPGIVEEVGTPVNAFNLNKMEDRLEGLKSIDIGNVKDLSATIGDTKATIKWSDPVDLIVKDTELQEITLATWAGTKVVRKEGSYPVSVNDGKLIVDSTTRDEFKTNGFEDTGLSNYITYYYMAFPYTEECNVIFDESNRTEVTPTPYTSDWTSGVSAFTAMGDFEEVQLSWVNPVIGDFKGVMVRRSTVSHPTEVTEGSLIYDGPLETFLDTLLVNDTNYYYSIWAYNNTNQFSNPANVKQVVGTPTDQKIYGFEIDESNSNPGTAVSYVGDSLGYVAARGNNGSFNWGSWEQIIKNEFKIRPCLLKNPTGAVNYYLNYDNFTKKEDGIVASILTGADGDVMIEFGQDIYWKMTRSGTKLRCDISSKPFAGAVKHAHEIEYGYNQFPYFVMMLTQILQTLMFKSRDSQSSLGRGYVDGNSAYMNTGSTNTKGFCYGESTGKLQMKFLGLEDYWGNRRQWIDGCFYDANLNILLGKSGFNDVGSGYVNYGKAMDTGASGYISKVQGGNETGFIPQEFSGSATTHYSDYGDLHSFRLPHFGGYLSEGVNAGGFSLHSNTASNSHAHIGSRLCAKFNGKIYLGVYLGVNEGSKLRSISGKVSDNNKTIGAFRTLAKANNA